MLVEILIINKNTHKQRHAEVLNERVEVDVLNRQLVFFKPIQLSSTLGGTYEEPVSHPVTGAGKTILLNKSLHGPRPVTIDLLPVDRQPCRLGSFSSARIDCGIDSRALSSAD